ncbi:Crp/Fnr family transcriptional regulator [Chitinophaga niabensis]|uniref:Crp/Fnr family transcriptional regulator n=1 Tax=Chitinophaga niabensis TaxID=536979 RepID=UPI0031BAE5CA
MSKKQPKYNISKSAANLSIDSFGPMYNWMFELFERIQPSRKGLKKMIIQDTRIEFFRKGEIIQENNKINRQCYFVFKGLVMASYIKDNGEEVTSWFMRENDVVISVRSFFTQQPSREVIIALEDTICISLSYEFLQKIYGVFTEFNFVGRVLTEKYYIQMEERAYSLRMDNATQRYNKLLTNHPDILQRVPLKYIASYLGITPQSLSRIRRKK